jgi:hypothetical protein
LYRLDRLEPPFAASACVDMAFHHPQRPVQLLRSLDHLLRGEGRKCLAEGNAEGPEHALALIFGCSSNEDLKKPKRRLDREHSQNEISAGERRVDQAGPD